MKDELISFETAKLAKEKGFTSSEGYRWLYSLDSKRKFIAVGAGYDMNIAMNAPTQSLLQRWLREEKDIHISLDFNSMDKHYYVYVEYLSFGSWTYSDQSNNLNKLPTYEAALEQGLQEALKTL